VKVAIENVDDQANKQANLRCAKRARTPGMRIRMVLYY